MGHFDLDSLVPGSKVDLSSHPLFNVSVVADGPTRVLKITDSPLSSSQTKVTLFKALQRRIKCDLSLCIDVGVSLVDWVPRELIYLSLGDVSISRNLSDKGDIMHFSIRRIAADCTIFTAEYPVLIKVATDSRQKDAVSISWCRDMNDVLGKDITLLRYASFDMGKLICKIDGVLIKPLLQMSHMAMKSLVHNMESHQPSLSINDITSKPLYRGIRKNSNHLARGELAIGSNINDPQSPTRNTVFEITHTPKHKFYIEKLNISAIKAELSYCGASPLPSWLSPAFKFETLPIRLPSFSCSYMYGSANEHIQRVKDHYNLWRIFLFGISLRPSFFARACLFTTKQSLLVILRHASTMLSSFSGQLIPLYFNQLTSGGARHDARARAPRLFVKQGDADVLVEYAEGGKSGRALLSRVRSGRYLAEGYISHGDLQGIGEYIILPYDGSFLYILTRERLLVLKKTTNIPLMVWELELQSIVHVETEKLPNDKVSLQIFHMENGNINLGTKLLLFNDSNTPSLVLAFILSTNKSSSHIDRKTKSCLS